MEFLAQADFLDALKPYGIAGIICAFFMARDIWQSRREVQREMSRETRDAAREQSRDARDAKREEMMWSVIGAVRDLTSAITLEVTTRPNVVQRALDEAHAIHNRATQK